MQQPNFSTIRSGTPGSKSSVLGRQGFDAADRGILVPRFQFKGFKIVQGRAQASLSKNRFQPDAPRKNDSDLALVAKAIVAQPGKKLVRIVPTLGRDQVLGSFEDSVDQDGDFIDQQQYGSFRTSQHIHQFVPLALPFAGKAGTKRDADFAKVDTLNVFAESVH